MKAWRYLLRVLSVYYLGLLFLLALVFLGLSITSDRVMTPKANLTQEILNCSFIGAPFVYIGLLYFIALFPPPRHVLLPLAIPAGFIGLGWLGILWIYVPIDWRHVVFWTAAAVLALAALAARWLYLTEPPSTFVPPRDR
jgi:hypothetical protein